MTLFIASLFLPYTIHFNVEKEKENDHRPVSRARPHSRLGSVDYDDGPTPSLFAEHEATISPIATSAAAIEAEEFFGLPSNKSVLSLRSLVPNEPLSPAWGRTSYFQPRSRAESPPPVSILKHGRPRLPRERTLKNHPTILSESREESHERALRDADWTVEPAEQGNGGLKNAINAATQAGLLKENTWVGTLGMPLDTLSEDRKAEIEGKLESEYDCLTVFPSDSDVNGHYTHYCKQILWPVFHYQIPDNPKSKAYEDHSWVYYVKVNQAFADRIINNYKRGDVIWIHDYHLILVPSMIRQKIPDAEIGFFFHIAFPSSEVFRCLSVRKELLEGMLGANLIGFQTVEYCHHFLQTCNRLLNAEATPRGLQLEDRFVDVATIPIGIDPKFLALRRSDPEVLEWIKRIETKYRGKHLVVARDKFDNVRGVRQKLLAYELFLEMYPQYKDNVVLIQVATSTNEQPELEATVSQIVARIASKHSTLTNHPLVFLRQDLPYNQYLAMITQADALMITCLREGMNLMSHEYIICQDGSQSPSKFAGTSASNSKSKKHGSLILSEFTGSASVFDGDELSVNPWDYRKCAEAIRQALEMSPEEKTKRWTNMAEKVMHHSAENWFKTFMDRLHKAWDEHSRQHKFSIPRLSTYELCEKYQSSKARLFMLDYEDTLAARPSNISYTSPQRTIDALTGLLYDERNIVYVMSSLKPEELDNLFRRVPRLGLIAENGCFHKEVGSESWYHSVSIEKMNAWKASILKILEYYQERVEGSRVEQRHCSILFHYRDAQDQQGAVRLAGDCANHINDRPPASQNLHVHAIHFEGGLLIESTEWNKGTAATRIFENINKQCRARGTSPPDFLMVAGNSREDEVIYRWANKLGEDKAVRDVFTISVSSRNTEAKSTLTQGVTGVLSALQKLATCQ